MKIIIAGCRDYMNYKVVRSVCDFYLSGLIERGEDIEIVTGGARGVDALGKNFATVRELPHKEFKANWTLHGRAGGPIRNKEMAEYADALIAFWDGKSKGTENMIKLAKEHGLRVKIYRI
jgi:hypothetical protein